VRYIFGRKYSRKIPDIKWR